MEIEIEGKIHRFNQYEGIEVRSLLPHQVFNKSNNSLEFLVISHPNSKEDRVITQRQSESQDWR